MGILVRVSKNILYKAISEILSRVIYLGFFIYMARKLGAGDFGLFSFAFSFVGIFVILIDPGLNTILVRDIARDRSYVNKYSSNMFTLKILLSIVIFLLIWIVINLLGYDRRTIIVVEIMGILLISYCFIDFMVAIVDALERMEFNIAIKVMNRLLVAVPGIVALLAGNKIVALISWMVIGSILSVLFASYLVKKIRIDIKMEFDWYFLKGIIHNALPVALTMFFAIIYFKIDVVMLSMFKVSNSKIGLYAAAIKLIEILNVIPAIFVGAIFPILSGFSDKSKSELESTFRKAYQILLIVAIPIVVTTAFRSEEIVRVIYGDSYIGSSIALQILIWTSIFIFPNFLLSNMIIIANKQKLNAIFSFFCLIINIILNIFLIPRYGFVGAGIATVLTDILLFILCTIFIIKYFESVSLLKDSLKPVVCGIVLALILFSLNSWKLIFILPITLIAYLLLILLTKTLSIDDFRAFTRGH